MVKSLEGIACEKGQDEKKTEGESEGQGALKGEGGGEEPTREGRRSEPVERRVPVADPLPNALQSGVVRCPPHPGEPAGRGGKQEGRDDQARKAPRPWHAGQMDTGHTKNKRDVAVNKRNKTKTKRKSRLVGVLSLGSGHTLQGGGEGVRQKKKRADPGSCFSQGPVDLLLSSRTPRPSHF